METLINTKERLNEFMKLDSISDLEFSSKDWINTLIMIDGFDISVTDVNKILSKNYEINFFNCNIINDDKESNLSLFIGDEEILNDRKTYINDPIKNIYLNSNPTTFNNCRFLGFNDIIFSKLNKLSLSGLRLFKCNTLESNLIIKNIHFNNLDISESTIKNIKLHCVNAKSISITNSKVDINVKLYICSVFDIRISCFKEISGLIDIENSVLVDPRFSGNIKYYSKDSPANISKGGLLGHVLEFNMVGYKKVSILDENYENYDERILKILIDRGSRVIMDPLTGMCKADKVIPLELYDINCENVVELPEGFKIYPLIYDHVDNCEYVLNKVYYPDFFSETLDSGGHGVHFFVNKELTKRYL